MHRSIVDKWTDTILVVFMIGLVIVTAYPMVYVLLASVSNGSELIQHTGLLLKPYGFQVESYVKVLQNPGILIGYGNTLFIVIASLIVSMSVTAMTAYVLSRKGVLWNNVFMFIIVFTMFFSGGLIPMYLIVKGVGLLNSLWSVIIPFMVNTFNLIIMRTAFKAIPDSLEESAKIDGANHFVVFTRIVMPLSMPVLAVMTLYYAVERWNGWFFASIFIRDRDLYPLQLVLREILIANSTDSMLGSVQMDQIVSLSETIKYATVIVATAPILCIYPFLQRYFVKGVMIGALKG